MLCTELTFLTLIDSSCGLIVALTVEFYPVTISYQKSILLFHYDNISLSCLSVESLSL